MSIYYIENEHGEYCSWDGKRRFIKLTGKTAYDYLSEHKDLRFYETSTVEEFGEIVFVEVPKRHLKEAAAWKNRENYVKRTMKENRLEIVSLSQPITEDGQMTPEDITSNRDESVEDEAIRNLDLETLRRALASLTAEEFCVIERLFLTENPMTERALAESMGKSQPYVNRLKRKIFDKIKKFF